VIADEASAIGWRLAGAEVHIPAAQTPSEHLRAARAHAQLVLITAPLAARLPAAELSEALHAIEPLVLVIPDLRHLEEPPDIAAEMRRALGVPA
jgi:vacuolar-type H+-ATPase subunit F/Vma7